MSNIRCNWRQACLIVFALAAGLVQAQGAAPPPPAAHFFENPGFGAARLSPNGRLLAVRIGLPGKRESLAVIDLATSKAQQVALFTDIDVGRFEWVNDKRLVFNTTDKELGAGDVREGPGLYAVNADGTQMRQLAKRRGTPFISSPQPGAKAMLPANTFMLGQFGKQDSDSIYVTQGGGGTTDLLRLDTTNARATEVPGPAGARAWFLDQDGEPRLATTLDKETMSLHVRDPDGKEWRKLASYPAYANGAFPFVPVGFGPDGQLYVQARAGKDISALHTFDLATGKVSDKAVLVTPGYDFNGVLVKSGGQLAGVRYNAESEGTHWFDKRMDEVQKKVDAALADTVNRISVPARPESPWVLVESYSDRQPRLTTLYNTETGKFNRVGAAHPQIKPAQMGVQSVVRYKARDGLEIPALLTLPPGEKASGLPLVVLVHGGPYVRGTHWGWQGDTQFLASRGYAVLEPEFRGSTGYGDKHFRAGWKQWGLAMQDDIADGAKWAIAEGLVDPRRICIAGASYGGYATLMGLANNPELFKCGIDYVGVTDINLLFNGHWLFQDDVSPAAKKYSMPVLIGDPKADAAQFAATSPIEQAARITQPLLLAYGGADRRVPIIHGKKFLEAVRKTNKDVEWIEYESEGHGWSLPQTRIDFWTRVEKFLDRNIGKP
jgi:dipeptidyl aminopeptidase/acylaminoacyl peptidase